MAVAQKTGAAGLLAPRPPKFFMPSGSEQGLQRQLEDRAVDRRTEGAVDLIVGRLRQNERHVAAQRAKRRVPEDRAADRTLERLVDRRRIDRGTGTGTR